MVINSKIKIETPKVIALYTFFERKVQRIDF